MLPDCMSGKKRSSSHPQFSTARHAWPGAGTPDTMNGCDMQLDATLRAPLDRRFRAQQLRLDVYHRFPAGTTAGRQVDLSWCKVAPGRRRPHRTQTQCLHERALHGRLLVLGTTVHLGMAHAYFTIALLTVASFTNSTAYKAESEGERYDHPMPM